MRNAGVATSELHAVAEAFRDSLPADAEIVLSRIDGLDRIGIPVVQAVSLGDNGGVMAGYGYGLTEIEAQVGALGELCEEVHVGAWVSRAECRVASHDSLVRAEGADAVVDPLTLCLPAGSDYTHSTVLSWLPAQRWPSGERVLVPAEWVAAHGYQLAAPPRLITPITNGLGAGFDLEHAVAHGVMELLQRDGNVVSYRALDQGTVIDLPAGTLPEIDAMTARLNALGIRPVFKLAALDFGMANLYVVGDDDGPMDFALQVSACGEAVHPDSGRALRKALLEFIGSRSRKAATHGSLDQARRVLPRGYIDRQTAAGRPAAEERRALASMADWLAMSPDALRALLADTVFIRNRQVDFSALPTAAAVSSSQDRLALLTRRLGDEGLGIIVVDCSPRGSPVRVVRVIVPGLESETMSYGRIGWRGVARLRQREDALVLDRPGAGALRVRLLPEDEARCGGPAWFDVTRAAMLTDPLYPLYRECGPFAAQRLLRDREATWPNAAKQETAGREATACEPAGHEGAKHEVPEHNAALPDSVRGKADSGNDAAQRKPAGSRPAVTAAFKAEC